jgi:hypothetical protein
MTKSTRPIISIHNIETDEIINREMNDAEFAQYEADRTKDLEAQAEVEVKKAQRQALLDRLGITADEAKLLLG